MCMYSSSFEQLGLHNRLEDNGEGATILLLSQCDNLPFLHCHVAASPVRRVQYIPNLSSSVHLLTLHASDLFFHGLHLIKTVLSWLK